MTKIIEKINSPKVSKTSTPRFSPKEQAGSLFFQPKLTIGPVDDIYEQEADAMSDKVMRMADIGEMQQPFFRSGGSTLQLKCAHCEEEEKNLQRKEINKKETNSNFELDSYVGHINSGGKILPNEVRNFYEPKFGYDFSKVKVHTDGNAAKSAQSINALAYTSGNNIVFNEGQYAPGTDKGKKLLAHELTHVVQQNAESALVPHPTNTTLKSPFKTIQRNGSGENSQSSEVCEALRSALANSIQVIELYNEFKEGNIQWEDMQSQRRTIGNAAQGVVGAGLELPQIVQEAISEVESFGFEEITHMGRLALGFLGSDEFFQSQWVTNEIERQNHYNLVLIRFMYENGCPDFPGQWEDFQQQILRIGTRGSEQRSSIETTPRETRTAVAWVSIGDEHLLVLATEVENSGRLRFEQWIDSDFRQLALDRATSIQGSIPSVPSSAVTRLPSSVPGSAARR